MLCSEVLCFIQRNTVQLVIVTDGTDTFAIYNYYDLSWIGGHPQNCDTQTGLRTGAAPNCFPAQVKKQYISLYDTSITGFFVRVIDIFLSDRLALIWEMPVGLSICPTQPKTRWSILTRGVLLGSLVGLSTWSLGRGSEGVAVQTTPT